MYKTTVVILTVTLAIMSCGKQNKPVLEKDTPLYSLTKEISKRHPALDPDANKAMITCKYFQVTPASFMLELQRNMGKNIDQLKGIDSSRFAQLLRTNVEQFAEQELLLDAAGKSGVKLSVADIDSEMVKIYTQNGGQEAFASDSRRMVSAWIWSEKALNAI